VLLHSANLMVRIFFNGGASSVVVVPCVSNSSSTTAKIASDAGSAGSWDVPSADPPRSGILSITGSYAFSCIKLGFLLSERKYEIPIVGKKPAEGSLPR
jgi:hypothetical protein